MAVGTVGMTGVIYNLILEHLPNLELDMVQGVILNRNAKSLSGGYLQLGIKGKKVYHHQIFAVARWGKECIGMTVNHRNEVKTDNSWGNLELLTHSDNLKAKTTKSCRYAMLPIRATNIDTGERFVFETQREAAKHLQLSPTSIFQHLSGQRRRVGRFTFERITA